MGISSLMNWNGGRKMCSATHRKKTLIVFRKPPRIEEARHFEPSETCNEQHGSKCALALKWEGSNYITDNNDKKIVLPACEDAESGGEVSTRKYESSLDRSSDDIVLHYNFKQDYYSTSDLSGDYSGTIYQVHHGIDVDDVKHNWTCEKYEDTLEAESLQSEFDAVMQASQQMPNLHSSSSAGEERIKKRGESQNEHQNSCIGALEIQGSTEQCEYIPRNIRRPSHGSARKLEIQPLCKPKVGKFNIMAFVLQVNMERVVRLKNGNDAKFASLYVADIDSDYVKLTLWHESKNWIQQIEVGFVIVVTDVIQHTWREQISLATTYSSEMVNFQRAKNILPESSPEIISKEALSNFVCCIEKKYPFILKNSGSIPSVNKVQRIESFDCLVAGTLVNVVALVVSICTENFSDHQKHGVQGPVVWLEDAKGRQIRLSLLGNQASILSLLRKNHRKWLKFTRLAVRALSNDVGVGLHSTSDTSVTIPRPFQQSSESCSQQKRKCTRLGEMIEGSVKFLEFFDQNGSSVRFSRELLDKLTCGCSAPFERQSNDSLVCLKDVAYTACSYCLSELDLAMNGGHEGCKRCIKTSWKYEFKKVEVLRPFKLHVDCGSLDLLPITVFPYAFNKLKAKVPLKYILEMCKIANGSPRNVFELRNSIAYIFEPRKFVFHVSREETSGTDTVTRDEMCILKDVEE